MLREALGQTSMFEREWHVHVSHRKLATQQVYTVFVVELLALDVIFARCVSPSPGLSMLDVVETRGLLD